MPKMISSTELKNDYNGISDFCHAYSEPVFVTKNGKTDLAVMSIETYEQLMGRFKLYGLMQEGLNDIRTGNARDFSDAIHDIRRNRS